MAAGRPPERAEKEPLRPAYARLARVKRRLERLQGGAGGVNDSMDGGLGAFSMLKV